MSQRFTLFYAGFTVYAPALYFSQSELIDSHKNSENHLLQTSISKFSETINEQKNESFSNLKTAISIAKNLEIELLPEPTSYENYFNWLTHYVDCIERDFPMGRIDHYYFLYARKISEINCNLHLLKAYINLTLSSQGTFDFSQKIEKYAKDIEFILFKLMAAAALLSSEPRQNYFNIYYKNLCQEFQPLKKMVSGNLTQEKELLQLESQLKNFEVVVMDGFKKCIGLLKELGV